MIRIHRCKLTINGSDALRDGSTISMDRIKKILAKHLAALENIPGRVHIKNVTLDLGEFQPLSINPEFIERLEETCANLGKKLKEIHAEEAAKSGKTTTSKQDRILKDELVGALYDLDQSKGIQNALYLVESEKSIQSILEWEAFQKKYSFLFQKRLSSKEEKWIKQLLQRFQPAKSEPLNVEAARAEWIEKGKKHAFSSREIDFILARMEKISIDSNWLNALEKAYFKEFQRVITPTLMTHLKQLYDSFEFSLSHQNDSADNRYGKSESVHSDLRYFFAGKEKNKRLEELINVIDSTSSLDEKQWFYALLKAYRQEHGGEMPLSIQKELLTFNAWRTSTSWQELPRKNRTAFVSKLKKYTTHYTQQQRKHKDNTFSSKPYQFLLEQLEKFELNAAWYAKIVHAYEQEFKSSLPPFLADLLRQFSAEISKVEEPNQLSLKVDSSKSSWLNVALAYFRNRSNSGDIVELLQQFDRIKPTHVSQWNRAFEKFIRSHTGESLQSPRFDELRRFEAHFRRAFLKQYFEKNRKELERMLEEARTKGQFSTSESAGNWELQKFIFLDILSEIEFNATWMISLKQRFKQLLGVDLPRAFLLTVERYVETFVFTETNQLPHFSTTSTPGLISVEVVRTNLEQSTEIQGVSELLSILPASLDPQKFVEIDSLFEGFESVHNRKIPAELEMRLQTIASSTSEWKVKLNQAFESVVLSAEERSFFSSTAHSATSYADWQNGIQTKYREHFGRSMPEKWNTFITRLEAEWTRHDKSKDAWDRRNRLHTFSTIAAADERHSNNRLEVIQQAFTNLRTRQNASDRAAKQHRELNFVLAFLDTHGLTLGWKAKLVDAFKSAFSMNLPGYIQQVLDEVDSAAKQFGMENLDAHISMDAMRFRMEDFLGILAAEDDLGWHQKLRMFVESLVDGQTSLSFKELIDRYEFSANESIPMVVQMNVRNALQILQQQELKRTKIDVKLAIQEHLKRTETVKQEQDFMRRMISEFPFDERWYGRVLGQFKQQFKKKIPKEFETMLEQFIQQAQARLDRHENMLNPSILENGSFFSDLKAYVEMHADLTNAERIGDLIEKGSFDANPSWLYNLTLAYSSTYREELPRELHGTLMAFAAQRTVIFWETIPFTKRTHFLDQLRPVLAKSLVSAPTKVDPKVDFSSIYAWLLALLEATPLNAAWYAGISKAFLTEFNQPIPEELNALLLDFSRELFSSKASVKSEIVKEMDGMDQRSLDEEAEDRALGKFEEKQSTAASENFTAALKVYLESQEVGADVETLLKVLESFSVPPNANWISKLSLVYSAEHGEKIPKELNEVLVSFATSRLQQSWDMITSEKSKNFLDQLLPVLAKSLVSAPTKGDTKVDFSSMYAWLLALLESTPLNAAWYASISKAFLTEFNQPIPNELNDLLIDFSRELFSSKASVKSEVVKEMDGMDQRSLDEEAEDRALGKFEEKQSTAASENFTAALKVYLESQEVGADVETLLKVLESFSVPPNANWISELSRAYSAENGEKIPKELNEVLVSFATSRLQQSWDMITSEKSKNFLDQLRPVLAKSDFASAKTDDPKVDFSSIYAWMLALLEATPLNAAWYASISKAFLTEFNQPIPNELNALLLDFSRQLFESNASLQSENLEENDLRDRLNTAAETEDRALGKFEEKQSTAASENFTAALKVYLESQEVGANVVTLLKVLESFTVPPNANWISELSRAYSAEYGEKLPKELNEVLVSFATSRLQQSWDMITSEKSKNFLDQLLPVLAKSDFASAKTDDPKVDFSSIYAWMLALLEATPLNAAWYASISKAFLTEFNQPIPNELNDLLIDFSRELFSSKVSTQSLDLEENDLKDQPSTSEETEDGLWRKSEVEQAIATSENFVTALKLHLASQTAGAHLDKLVKVLESFSFAANANWISELSRAYSAEFGEKLPQELNEVLVSFATSRLQQSWNMMTSNKSKNFLDQLRPVLAKSDFDSTKTDDPKVDFSSIYAWLLVLLEATPLNAAWYASISKAFLAEFNQPIPNELNALLLDFSRELFSSIEAVSRTDYEVSPPTEIESEFATHADQQDVEATFGRVYAYALDALKHLCTDDEFTHLRNWLEAGSRNVEQEWLGILKHEYPEHLGMLSSELKSALHQLATVFDRFKQYVPLEEGLRSLRELIHRRYSELSGSANDVKMATFLTEWLNQSHFAQESIQTMERNFELEFTQTLDSAIQFHLRALLFNEEKRLKRLDEESKRSENMIDLQTAKNHEFIATTLQQKWMIAKVEQVVIGRLTLDDLSNEYQTFFGSEIPTQLNHIAREAVEQGNKLERDETNITAEIRQFLRNKPMDATLLALISFFDATFECTPSNWFKESLENYATRFNQPMPMAMQHHLLSFAAQRTSSHSSNEARAFGKKMAQRSEALAQNWESFSLKELTSMTHSNFRQLEAELTFVHAFLKSTWFTQADLDLLELDFERKFGAPIPETWQQHLAKMADVDPEEQPSDTSKLEKIEARSVRDELMEFLGTVDKTEDTSRLQQFIEGVPIELDTNWFPKLLAHYLESEGQKMPHALQAILLRFMQRRTENRTKQATRQLADEKGGDLNAMAKAKQVLARYFQQPADPTKPQSQQLEAIFVEIWKEKRTDWVDDFAHEYKKNYQRWFPNELMEALKSLDDGAAHLETDNAQRADWEEKGMDVKERLLHFMKSFPQLASNQLLEIISGHVTLHPETWYDSLREMHKRHFGTPLSESDQHALLKFAANDEFTVSEMERLSRVQAKTNIAVKLVTNFFTNQNKEGQKVDHILYFLEGRIERDGMLTSAWKSELHQSYLNRFSEELPIGIVTHIENGMAERPWNSFLRQLEEELIPMVATQNGLTNTELKKRRESIRKPLTNKAKLLQLKEKLEAMKKGKKVEELPLISNAGIILGWVFWKSTFTQFEWLEDGRFKEVDGIHSSILAANWLHYSVNESETVNPLILAICDLTEERYQQLSIEELEANMNGNQLETSITNFYETILSMWPIFEINQHQELIELFISREGILGESPIGRRLKMVKEPFDHLLTIHPIPWPISILNFSWSSLIIEVVWD